MSTDISCPARAQVPVQWAAANTTETIASCSIPSCNDNRDVLQECCSRFSNDTNVEVEEFNSDTGLYLTCSISSDYVGFDDFSDQNSAYQSYMDCLANDASGALLCNRPRNQTDDVAAGPLQCVEDITLAPPARVGEGNEGDIVCGMRHEANATEALRRCCGDSNIQAYGLGCFASCPGSADLESCLRSEYQGDGDGGLSCIAARETDTSDAVGRTWGTLGGVLLFAVVAVLLQ